MKATNNKLNQHVNIQAANLAQTKSPTEAAKGRAMPAGKNKTRPESSGRILSNVSSEAIMVTGTAAGKQANKLTKKSSKAQLERKVQVDPSPTTAN